jgi:hypothetical protein
VVSKHSSPSVITYLHNLTLQDHLSIRYVFELLFLFIVDTAIPSMEHCTVQHEISGPA